MPDQTRINSLIAHPSESLNVEIKRWFDIDATEGIAKLVKAVLALRNRNGGFLVIGFDNLTLLPDNANRPIGNLVVLFHVDKIQGLISKYASEQFEIAVEFGILDEQPYPVIVVPEGVTTPVAAKRDLRDASGSFVIKEGDVFFRTLGANGTPSTARAKASDWRAIVEICFENREADLARFLRRHLANDGLRNLTSLLSEVIEPQPSARPTLRSLSSEIMGGGGVRLARVLAEREPTCEQSDLLTRGKWSVALAIEPSQTDAIADRNFLNVVAGANPQYTGWPIWLDSRNFTDSQSRPYVFGKGWEALIVSTHGWSRHIDFMRLVPRGQFFLFRILQDDLIPEKVEPLTSLDPVLVLIRVAEAIAVGLSMAKALGWKEDARLGFTFKWVYAIVGSTHGQILMYFLAMAPASRT